jgi:hypothetical protein
MKVLLDKKIMSQETVKKLKLIIIITIIDNECKYSVIAMIIILKKNIITCDYCF